MTRDPEPIPDPVLIEVMVVAAESEAQRQHDSGRYNHSAIMTAVLRAMTEGEALERMAERAANHWPVYALDHRFLDDVRDALRAAILGAPDDASLRR